MNVEQSKRCRVETKVKLKEMFSTEAIVGQIKMTVRMRCYSASMLPP